jgi:DNA-binding winged helix-turn-helix (wHTH) protein/TolB-like protein/cytochrome c-type biogenesis protein CcmH/NrfG
VAQQLTIGEWTVESALNTLRREDQSIQIEPKTMQVLLCLAREPGEVFGKERIIEEVWPETFVTDGVLWNAISELRRAFGDDPHHPKYIATIPKSGYRLVAPAAIKEISNGGPSIAVGSDAHLNVPAEIPPEGDSKITADSDPDALEGARPDVRDRARAGPVQVPGAGRGTLWPWAGVGALGLLLGVSLLYFLSLPVSRGDAIDSIAVLPLENSSRDPELDYLAEGISGAIADSLARLAELRVIPTSSTARYRGVADLPEVARELGVRTLLTGTLQTQGDDLSIRVELIDTSDNRLLWGRQFRCGPDDLLALQNEIAREISDNLRLRLTREEERQLSLRLTDDPEAYQLYLKGRYFRKQVVSPESFRKAVHYLEEATRRDPDFAAAYAALADAYLYAAIIEGWSVVKREQGRVERAATRAIELDPNLVDARLVLGLTRGILHFDPHGYEGALRKALELNPRHADAHRELARHLARAGRLEEALKHGKVSQQLDPLAPNATGGVGDVYYLRGDYQNAAELYEMALELSLELDSAPKLHFARQLGWVYWQQGRFDHAVRSFEQGQGALELLYAHRILGRRDKVEELGRQVREDLEKLLQDTEPRPAEIARYYMALGDVDETFRWLNICYDRRDISVTNIRTNFLINELREDPRFAELHRRIWGSDPS